MNPSIYLFICLLCISYPSISAEEASNILPSEQESFHKLDNENTALQGKEEKKKKKKTNPHAHLPQYQIIVGEALPPLLIEEYGEVMLVDDKEVSYQPWRSDKVKNRVQLIHYLAGRRSASKRQKNFSDQLEALQLDANKHHVTTIINAGDAFLGTSALVAGRLDNSKREYPQISVVGDKTGIGAHSWSLKPKGSAIIFVNAEGTVIFFKQDKFSQQQVDEALQLFEDEMLREKQ